ncbi:hypothetical protein F3Y22_tig00006666pilonHSYRG00070 [Hibiscus syriacus]|uniref:Receptor ligand binding region domain-containing protein n=1 Tax=Hibiscus syriacus TaxID=106335 RepID=A0A6A3CB71_HIBSY|nr:hypothetical protein F3Y22_tig00006666pilonHSYRG00070 [Hibiscus syriacus]
MDFTRKTKWTLGLVIFLLSLLEPLSASVNSISASTTEEISVHVGLIVDRQSWVGKVVDSCISMAISDFYDRNRHNWTKLVLHNRDSEGDPLLLLSHDDPSRTEVIATIVEAFGWRTVILIYEDNDSARQILSNVITSFEETDVRLAQHIALLVLSTDEEIIQQLKMLKDLQTSVSVVHMSPILASRLFLNAKPLGMISQGYAWITTGVITNFMNSMDPPVIESMQGVVGFKHHMPASKELRRFATRWKSKNLNEDQNLQEMELNVYGIWSYDMVQALATAAERVMTRQSDKVHKETR